MPILWRYLLRNYFQVLLLCVTVFIAILLVTRFQDIACFASSTPQKQAIILFILYQVPWILPLAVPVSCLIATLLLFQRLSHSHELTALRASGLGLRLIVLPLLLAGAFLSLFNFVVASEISPHCRILSKELIYQTTTTNPLLFLQKNKLVHFKTAYVDMRVLHAGKYARDVVIVGNNKSNGRLCLMTAKELSLEGELLNGSKVALISSVDSKLLEGFDHLVIENQDSMSTTATHLSSFICKASEKKTTSHLPLKMVLAKKESRKSKHWFRKESLEIIRRISIGLAAFTFTLIGASFGIEIGRSQRKRGFFWAISLGCFFMLSFFVAKSLKNPALAAVIYILPHFIIGYFSLQSLKKVSGGIE